MSTAHQPYNFQAARHAYRDLCDIPAGDRTDEQKARHTYLGLQVETMKRIVAVAEPLKARTNGKMVPLVLSTPTEPEAPALVQIILGSTGVTLHSFPADQAETVLRGMLVAVEIARQ